MPQTIISLPERMFERLRSHLLPAGSFCEEAAFLFTRAEQSQLGLTLCVVEELLIPPDGFTSRSRYYLELADETRARVIKRAHDLGAGLVECHSHPVQRGACFSWSDLHGFDEFVPHVRWRLPLRAYAAVVFAPDSVDALVWEGSHPSPRAIDIIRAGSDEIAPTQHTLTDWSEIYERKPL